MIGGKFVWRANRKAQKITHFLLYYAIQAARRHSAGSRVARRPGARHRLPHPLPVPKSSPPYREPARSIHRRSSEAFTWSEYVIRGPTTFTRLLAGSEIKLGG